MSWRDMRRYWKILKPRRKTVRGLHVYIAILQQLYIDIVYFLTSFISIISFLLVWAKKLSKLDYDRSKKKLSHIVEKQESLLKGKHVNFLVPWLFSCFFSRFSMSLPASEFVWITNCRAENAEQRNHKAARATNFKRQPRTIDIGSFILKEAEHLWSQQRWPG